MLFCEILMKKYSLLCWFLHSICQVYLCLLAEEFFQFVFYEINRKPITAWCMFRSDRVLVPNFANIPTLNSSKKLISSLYRENFYLSSASCFVLFQAWRGHVNQSKVWACGRGASNRMAPSSDNLTAYSNFRLVYTASLSLEAEKWRGCAALMVGPIRPDRHLQRPTWLIAISAVSNNIILFVL